MKTLTINYDDKGLTLKFSEPESADQVFNLALQTILSTVEQTIDTAPESVQAELRDHLYHYLNNSFTTLLELVDPQQSLRPTLTEAAILLAENQILDEAERAGMSLEEYLPYANQKAEEKLTLFKRNEEGRKRHNIKIRRQ
jgi:hypothetical protein